MGGMGIVDDEYDVLGDVYIFSTENETLERKIQNLPGLIQFQALGNKVAQFEENVIVALVENDFETENEQQTYVVEYKKGQKIVKQIHTF